MGYVLTAAAPDFGRRVAPLCRLPLLHYPTTAICSCAAVACALSQCEVSPLCHGLLLCLQPPLIGLEIMVCVYGGGWTLILTMFNIHFLYVLLYVVYLSVKKSILKWCKYKNTKTSSKYVESFNNKILFIGFGQTFYIRTSQL